MDLVWFRTSVAWSLLGELSSARDVAMFVAVADDDHVKPMITARPHGRPLSGLGGLSPAVAAVLRITATAVTVTVPFRVFR